MKKKYRSDIAASIHETAEGLYQAGLLDLKTMQEFDEHCLSTVNTDVRVPNAITAETLAASDLGVDVVECKDKADLFQKLGLMDKNTSVADMLSMPPGVGDFDFDPPRLTAKLFRPAEF